MASTPHFGGDLVVMTPPRRVASTMWCALHSGDEDTAKRLADMVDEEDLTARHFFYGSTVFHKACSVGSVDVAQILLRRLEAHGLDADTADNVGNSPLFAAVNYARSLPVARLLLKVSSDDILFDRNNAGQLCVHAACQAGDLELLQLACAHNERAGGDDESARRTLALLGMQDSYGCTPMFTAALHGHHRIVEWLLSFPSLDVNLPNRSGSTPFLAACERDHVTVVAMLAADARVSVVRVNVFGLSPFAASCRAGCTRVVKFLMGDARADISRRTGEGCTPFFEAAVHGRLDVVRLLARSNRVNVNRTTRPTAWTPLYGACFAGHVAVVEYLLTLGAVDVHRADSSGWSPVHVACFMGRLDVIRVLHASGRLDVNVPTLHGTSGFAIACQHRNREVVGVLLELAGERIQPSVFFHEGRLLTYKGVPVPCPMLDSFLPLEARDYTLARRRKRKARKRERQRGGEAATSSPTADTADPIAQYLTNTIVTDAHLDMLSQQLRFIGELGLRNCTNVTTSGLRLVAERCPCIRKLDVRGCPNLTVLPFELAALPLDHVFVDAGAMEFPPPDVCRKGSVAVADFLRSTRSDKQEPCNVMKLVMLGGPLEGKSSVLRVLRRYNLAESDTGPMQPVGDLERTRTADVAMWHVQWPTPKGQEHSTRTPEYVDFVVYDLSGRNASLAARFGVLSHRSLFMVAVDLSRWDESDPKGPVIDHSGVKSAAQSGPGESKNGSDRAPGGKPKLNRGVTVEIDSIPPANRPDRVLETLTLIQSYVPGARVMLVGTHLDKIGFVEGVRRMNVLLDIVTEHVVQVNQRLEERRAAVNESVRAYDQEQATPLANHLTGLQKATEQLQRSVAWPLVGAAAVSCVTGDAITLVAPSSHQGPWDTHKRMWHQYPSSGEVGAKAVVESVLTAIREHMSHVVFRRTINASFLRLARMAMFDLGSSIISDRSDDEGSLAFAPIMGGESFESESPLQRRMDGRAWMPLEELVDHVVLWQNCSRAKAELAIDFIAEVGLVVTVPSEAIGSTVFLHPQWLFHRLHCVISRPPRKLRARVADVSRSVATVEVSVFSDHAPEHTWTTRITLAQLNALRAQALEVLVPAMGEHNVNLPPLPTGCSGWTFRCQRRGVAVATLDRFIQSLMNTPPALLHPYLLKDLLRVRENLPFAAQCEGQRPPFTVPLDIVNFYATGVFSNTVLKRLFRRDNNDTRNVLRVALVERGLLVPVSASAVNSDGNNIFNVPQLRSTPTGEGIVASGPGRAHSPNSRPAPRIYQWHIPLAPSGGRPEKHVYMRHRVGLLMRSVPEALLSHLHQRWCMDESMHVVAWDPTNGGSCHLRSAMRTQMGYEHVVVTRTVGDNRNRLGLQYPHLVPLREARMPAIDSASSVGVPTTHNRRPVHVVDVVAFYDNGGTPHDRATRWRVVDCVVSDAIHMMLQWWPGCGLEEFVAVRFKEGPSAGSVYTIPTHAVRVLAEQFPANTFPTGYPYQVLGDRLPPWEDMLLPSEMLAAMATQRTMFTGSSDEDTSGVDAESTTGSEMADNDIRPAGVPSPHEHVELVSELEALSMQTSPALHAGDEAMPTSPNMPGSIVSPNNGAATGGGATAGAGVGAGAGAGSAGGPGTDLHKQQRESLRKLGDSSRSMGLGGGGGGKSTSPLAANEKRAALAGSSFMDHARARVVYGGRARSSADSGIVSDARLGRAGSGMVTPRPGVDAVNTTASHTTASHDEARKQYRHNSSSGSSIPPVVPMTLHDAMVQRQSAKPISSTHHGARRPPMAPPSSHTLPPVSALTTPGPRVGDSADAGAGGIVTDRSPQRRRSAAAPAAAAAHSPAAADDDGADPSSPASGAVTFDIGGEPGALSPSGDEVTIQDLSTDEPVAAEGAANGGGAAHPVVARVAQAGDDGPPSPGPGVILGGVVLKVDTSTPQKQPQPRARPQRHPAELSLHANSTLHSASVIADHDADAGLNAAAAAARATAAPLPEDDDLGDDGSDADSVDSLENLVVGEGEDA